MNNDQYHACKTNGCRGIAKKPYDYCFKCYKRTHPEAVKKTKEPDQYIVLKITKDDLKSLYKDEWNETSTKKVINQLNNNDMLQLIKHIREAIDESEVVKDAMIEWLEDNHSISEEDQFHGEHEDE